MSSILTRRDRCYVIGRRASRLNLIEAGEAWLHLAKRVEELGDADVPKFKDLLISIRVATVIGRKRGLK